MKTREIVTMGILSAFLLAAQVSLGFLPNIELVTLLLIVYTLVLKKKVFFVSILKLRREMTLFHRLLNVLRHF